MNLPSDLTLLFCVVAVAHDGNGRDGRFEFAPLLGSEAEIERAQVFFQMRKFRRPGNRHDPRSFLPENAEDAVMQLFEELTYKVKQYEITHFKSWLYRVAQNHCLQFMRRKHLEFTADWQSQPADSDE
ncbi:MAG: hypothetical protein K2I43_02975, partial [Alistipes sp.]|nr:hypothetical protein [Alistipes sp.]